MAGAAPSAKPAPFVRPLDMLDRGVLLAESALSVVVVLVMVLVAVAESLAGLLGLHHPILRSASDVLLHGTIWAAFLGASFATRGRKHLAIDVLGRLLPERGRRAVVGIAATLGAVVAFALARGIYTALVNAAHDATEQLANLQRSGATAGEVDRSYEFQFVIPAGFLLIAIRLVLHAFHEFVAAVRGDAAVTGAVAKVEAGPYRETAEESVENARDVVDPAHGAPVSHATATEIYIALGALALLVVIARGTTVMGPLALGCVLAALTLAIPLALRWRERKSLAPTMPRESDPGVVFTPAQLGMAALGVLAVAGAAYMGVANIQRIPIAWGVLFFAVMAILGAPLFTFLGGLALFLWLHGSPDVPAQSLSNSVEDALGPHFARMSVLPTIPVFTLAGYLMSESKTPQRLVRVARALLGWLPGGLAIVCVLASAFFTIFSGASGITIVAIGGLLLPALLKDKYPERFSLGLVTTGGALGITVLPCLPLIVYGIVAGLQEMPPDSPFERLELQKFLVAGLLPGALTVALFAVYAMIVGVVAKVPRSKFDAREAGAALWEAKWELVLPLFLIVGLVSGVFNPTQAAAFTAFYVLVVEVFIYKDLSLTKDLPRIIPESMILVGAIFVKLCAATVLTAYFIQAQTADKLFEWLTCGPPAQQYMAQHADVIGTCRDAVDQLAQVGRSSGGIIDSKLSFLLVLNVFLLIVGMLMDIFSAIVVVVPLIMGIALHFGVNPYHLGIVFLINLEIGYLMPPMGLNLFIAGFRFNRPVPDLYRAVAPFIGIFVIGLLITTYVPSITLALVPGHGLRAQTSSAPSGSNPLALPTTPTAPAGDAGAAAVADAGAGASGEVGGGDCDVPGVDESMEDFERRCNLAGGDGGAAGGAGDGGSAGDGGQGANPPPGAAAPTPPDCDEPRVGEPFPDFARRCHLSE